MRRKKSTATKRPAKSRGKRWSDEIKAEAMAQLLQGIRPSEVSEGTGVPDQTVRDWAKELGGIDALRQGRVDHLLYDYLTEGLLALTAISVQCRDSKWLKEQDAPGLAVVYGIISDKTTRILAAMERARPAEDIPTE
ncbi:MAG: transposase [Armatimonadetes bacterium]|nr:transposase [Armatimonadota bacterium]